MRKTVIPVLLMVLAVGVPVFAQTRFSIGSTCLAYWEDNKYSYVGTVAEESNTVKGGGYLVIFADGDQAVVPSALVRPMDIKVGSKVQAMWSNKLFYPGTVAKIVGGALYIKFDDGDEGWTSWAGIAVKLD